MSPLHLYSGIRILRVELRLDSPLQTLRRSGGRRSCNQVSSCTQNFSLSAESREVQPII